MKKLIFTVSLLAATVLAFAQPPMPGQGPQMYPNAVRATSGEAYITKQSTYTPSFACDGKNGKVRNVILLIGDGMGIGATSSAMYANGGLTMTNLKTMGYVRTQSADNFTTDSAASGTAYATGQKTNNGYLGVGPDHKNIPDIPEIAAPLGFACGVLSTDDLNGATPAAFFAHQGARGNTSEIWADLPNSCLDFASAGSESVYKNLSLKTQDAISAKFTVVFSPDDKATIDNSKRLVYLPQSVLFKDRGNYLPETTEMAINYLSRRGKKGFFLMVEGARIDKESHANNYQGMVNETLDFDKAIEAAIRFAEKDGHTLVIISADHETGAVTLSNANPGDGYAKGVYASRQHSPIYVPLYAYGPHSRDFSGMQENSDVGAKIIKLLTGKK